LTKSCPANTRLLKIGPRTVTLYVRSEKNLQTYIRPSWPVLVQFGTVKVNILNPFVVLFSLSDKNRNMISHAHIYTNYSWVSRKRGVNKFTSVISTFIYEVGEIQEAIKWYAYNVFKNFLISWKKERGKLHISSISQWNYTYTPAVKPYIFEVKNTFEVCALPHGVHRLLFCSYFRNFVLFVQQHSSWTLNTPFTWSFFLTYLSRSYSVW
jgi:hypothetical protein